MTLTVTDQLLQLSPSGTGKPVVGQVLATPSSLPFIMKIGSVWQDLQAPDQAAQTDANGNWSIVLPWPSESNPSTVTWQLSLPDGTIWQGSVPEGVAGPLSIYQLKTTYAWAPVASAFSSSAVATTSTLGAVLVDQNPSSGNPIALTQGAIRSAVPATPSYGLFSMGSGPFDGTSAGHFAGAAGGTALAMNLAANPSDYLRVQVSGSDRIRFTDDGGGFCNLQINGYQFSFRNNNSNIFDDGTNFNFNPASRGIALGEGQNLPLGTATGSKIGTATAQKLGFFNATPVTQRSSHGAVTAAGTYGANEQNMLNDVYSALRSLGLMA